MPLLLLYNASGPVPYFKIQYRIFIALMVAHYLVVHGEPETIWQIFYMPYYYSGLLWSFTVTLIVGEFIYLGTKWLDLYVIWINHKIKRAILQGIVAGLLPIMLIYFLMAYYFLYFGGSNDFQQYLKFDFPIVVCFIIILNTYYFITYLLNFKFQEPKKNLSNDLLKKPEPEMVEDMAVVYAQERICFALTFSNELITFPKTLNECLAILAPEDYFLINRSKIVHFASIEDYTIHDSRTLLITLKPYLNLDRKLIVSQRKIVEFKKWYCERLTNL